MNTVDVSGLVAYPGTRQKGLILQVMLGLTAAKDVTLLTGIKSNTQFTKLTTASVMRPFASNFSATTSGLVYSDREMVTRQGKGEWLIDTNDYKKSWLEEMMPEGFPKADKDIIPYAKWAWAQIIAQGATDINQNTIYNGVFNANGNTAADIADGFGTILGREITAGKVTPLVTGSMATDTVNKVEALYKSFDPKYRDMEMQAYMSYATYDKYCEDYRERFKTRSIPDNFLQQAIAHSDGKCFLKPALWMGSSSRVIIAPKANLVIGTDKESDLNTLRAVPDVWTVKVGLAMNIGCQFRDLEVLKCNDQV